MSKEMRDSMKVIQAMKQANNVHQELARLLEQAKVIVEEVDPSNLAPGQAGDYGFIRQLANEGEDLADLMSYYLEADFITGTLTKMPNDRYCIDGDPSTEFYSGSMIQYQDKDNGIFYTSRVEYTQPYGYYIVDLGREKPIEGLTVRKKY